MCIRDSSVDILKRQKLYQLANNSRLKAGEIIITHQPKDSTQLKDVNLDLHKSDYVFCDRYFIYKLEHLAERPVVNSNKYLTVTHVSEEAVKEIYRSTG